MSTSSNGLLAIALCVVGSTCRDVQTTWSAEFRSPDGHWLATARTESWGGPGTAFDATTVYLKQGTQAPVEVLAFSHGGQTMNLTMRWTSPTHLDVTYGPKGSDSVVVDFQAVKVAGVDISLQTMSRASPQ